MILTDAKIKQLIDDGIIKYSSVENINPWSLDVCLDDTLLRERRKWEIRKSDDSTIWRKYQLDHFENYQLKPQEFILGSTIEYLNLPDNIGAELYLKSSRAREGFDHAKAVWIDPGFSGSITLEIRNNLRFNSLKLFTGLKIAQLVFYQGEKPQKSYRETGRYNGFDRVQESLG